VPSAFALIILTLCAIIDSEWSSILPDDCGQSTTAHFNCEIGQHKSQTDSRIVLTLMLCASLTAICAYHFQSTRLTMNQIIRIDTGTPNSHAIP
jgi:hypothetical protein